MQNNKKKFNHFVAMETISQRSSVEQTVYFAQSWYKNTWLWNFGKIKDIKKKKMLKCNYKCSMLSTDLSINCAPNFIQITNLLLGIQVQKTKDLSAQSLTITLKVGF